jgi:hypothetical protein
MSETTRIESPKGLNVYKLAYKLAMEIFELTKKFPVKKIRANQSDSTLFQIQLRGNWSNARRHD